MGAVAYRTDPSLTPRGERTRQALLRAAEAVFGERGFDKASISEITRTAGVSQGSFYTYFPDKTAVFLHLVDELGRLLRHHLRDRIGARGDRLAVERVGLEAFFAFCRDHRNLYRIVRQAEYVDEAAYRGYYRRIAGGYAAGLADAMDRGEIRRADPLVLAYALMGVADFVGMRFVLWEEEVDPAALADRAMVLIEGLAPPPA